MSKTKKNSTVRDPFDYYPTPEWCVHRLLEQEHIFIPTHGPSSLPQYWFEPSAGDGAIIRAVNSFSSKKTGPFRPAWIASDIQPHFQPTLAAIPGVRAAITADFDKIIPEPLFQSLNVDQPRVIITNPPFKHALSFAKKLLEEYTASTICLLLRLNFLGSAERSSFMRENMPDIYILPNRPSFTGVGSDSIEYAWFVWSAGSDFGRSGQGWVSLLDDTPASVRKASKAESVKTMLKHRPLATPLILE